MTGTVDRRGRRRNCGRNAQKVDSSSRNENGEGVLQSCQPVTQGLPKKCIRARRSSRVQKRKIPAVQKMKTPRGGAVKKEVPKKVCDQTSSGPGPVAQEKAVLRKRGRPAGSTKKVKPAPRAGPPAKKSKEASNWIEVPDPADKERSGLPAELPWNPAARRQFAGMLLHLAAELYAAEGSPLSRETIKLLEECLNRSLDNNLEEHVSDSEKLSISVCEPSQKKQRLLPTPEWEMFRTELDESKNFLPKAKEMRALNLFLKAVMMGKGHLAKIMQQVLQKKGTGSSEEKNMHEIEGSVRSGSGVKDLLYEFQKHVGKMPEPCDSGINTVGDRLKKLLESFLTGKAEPGKTESKFEPKEEPSEHIAALEKACMIKTAVSEKSLDAELDSCTLKTALQSSPVTSGQTSTNCDFSTPVGTSSSVNSAANSLGKLPSTPCKLDLQEKPISVVVSPSRSEKPFAKLPDDHSQPTKSSSDSRIQSDKFSGGANSTEKNSGSKLSPRPNTFNNYSDSQPRSRFSKPSTVQTLPTLHRHRPPPGFRAGSHTPHPRSDPRQRHAIMDGTAPTYCSPLNPKYDGADGFSAPVQYDYGHGSSAVRMQYDYGHQHSNISTEPDYELMADTNPGFHMDIQQNQDMFVYGHVQSGSISYDSTRSGHSAQQFVENAHLPSSVHSAVEEHTGQNFIPESTKPLGLDLNLNIDWNNIRSTIELAKTQMGVTDTPIKSEEVTFKTEPITAYNSNMYEMHTCSWYDPAVSSVKSENEHTSCTYDRQVPYEHSAGYTAGNVTTCEPVSSAQSRVKTEQENKFDCSDQKTVLLSHNKVAYDVCSQEPGHPVHGNKSSGNGDDDYDSSNEEDDSSLVNFVKELQQKPLPEPKGIQPPKSVAGSENCADDRSQSGTKPPECGFSGSARSASDPRVTAGSSDEAAPRKPSFSCLSEAEKREAQKKFWAKIFEEAAAAGSAGIAAEDAYYSSSGDSSPHSVTGENVNDSSPDEFCTSAGAYSHNEANEQTAAGTIHAPADMPYVLHPISLDKKEPYLPENYEDMTEDPRVRKHAQQLNRPLPEALPQFEDYEEEPVQLDRKQAAQNSHKAKDLPRALHSNTQRSKKPNQFDRRSWQTVKSPERRPASSSSDEVRLRPDGAGMPVDGGRAAQRSQIPRSSREGNDCSSLRQICKGPSECHPDAKPGVSNPVSPDGVSKGRSHKAEDSLKAAASKSSSQGASESSHLPRCFADPQRARLYRPLLSEGNRPAPKNAQKQEPKKPLLPLPTYRGPNSPGTERPACFEGSGPEEDRSAPRNPPKQRPKTPLLPLPTYGEASCPGSDKAAGSEGRNSQTQRPKKPLLPLPVAYGVSDGPVSDKPARSDANRHEKVAQKQRRKKPLLPLPTYGELKGPAPAEKARKSSGPGSSWQQDGKSVTERRNTESRSKGTDIAFASPLQVCYEEDRNSGWSGKSYKPSHGNREFVKKPRRNSTGLQETQHDSRFHHRNKPSHSKFAQARPRSRSPIKRTQYERQGSW